MKKISSFLITAIIFIAVQFEASAQYYGMYGKSKVVKESGDLSFLKGQKNLKIEYNYDNLGVGQYKTEQEYIDKKVGEYNAKEPGKGDKWLEGWKNNRKERFQPKFQELFNKNIAKLGITAGNDVANAQYTLIVKTTFIEPGYNVGISKRPAFVNLEFNFIEAANPAKSVGKFYILNLIGSQAMGFDFDSGSRIAESYAKGGKMFGGYIVKNIGK